MNDREKYEGIGFFTRLVRMCRGFRQPRDTAAYKLARIELQRLAAPISAIVLVALLFVAAVVMTAMTDSDSARPRITIATLDLDIDPIIQEDPPDDPPVEPIDPTIDVTDVFATAEDPKPATPVPLPPAPGGAPSQVARTPSPVTLNAVVAGLPGIGGLGPGGGGFGTEVKGGGGQDVTGCLIGRIVDFKSNADGTPRPAYSAEGTYWKDAKSLVDQNFSESAFGQFFSPVKRVALTHLWVPPQASENGPKAFGVGDVVKPSGFAVYYTGTLRSATPGRYRLWGYFDDFMLVRINGKTVLDAVWNTGGLSAGKMTGWQTSDRAAVGRVKCPQGGGKMAPSDWFTVDAKHPVEMELFVGERPGGLVGGVLLIEQEGVEYAKAADGTMILPVFASRPLAETTKLDLAEASYPMSGDSPRFNARPRGVTAVQPGDVDVTVNI
ncbi:MAG: hypothetical protein ACI4R9_06260 [Kiritimatiellia bacterium]